jgi:hypothetical protein
VHIIKGGNDFANIVNVNEMMLVSECSKPIVSLDRCRSCPSGLKEGKNMLKADGGNSSARNHAYEHKFLGRKGIEKCQLPYDLYF